MASYQLRLEARNEGLIYREGVEVYRFNVKREGKRWLVSIPFQWTAAAADLSY